MDTQKLIHRAAEFVSAGKYGEALECYDILLLQIGCNAKKNLDTEDKLQVWDGYLSILGVLGDYAQLIKWVSATLVNEPKWLNGRLSLGVALIESGNLGSGLEQLQIAGVPPTFYQALTIGNAQSGLKNWQAAQRIYLNGLVSAADKGSEFGVGILVAFIETVAREQSSAIETEKKISHLLSASDPSVFRYQVARYHRIDDVRQSFKCEPAVTAKADDDDRYLRLYSGKSRCVYSLKEPSIDVSSFMTPIIDPHSLGTNIEKFFKLVAQLLNAGIFSSQLDNIRDMQSSYGRDTEDPVMVLSTGRCGTESLHLFLETSPFVESYHTMHLVLAPCERNHLLYRLITGNLDEEVVGSILKLYLESRTAEFASAYRMNKTPILVNHWDTVFAPFIAAIFPQSRFIYLKRDEVKVGRSQITKNQWRNRQLQHWRFDPKFTNGEFNYTRDETLPLAAEIAWYLRITEVFSLAFLRTIDDERSIKILSEDLFERSENVYVGLCKWLPSAKFSRESYDDIFGTIHNEKNDFIAYTDSTVDRLSASLIEYLEKLTRYGGFIN
ncbi:MAG: hypothetical protein CMF69_08920 [Magnetovibrio sp.]|nr:hypothetical protein [Magnetovibrio sp.]